MKKMKKILAVMLSLAMILGMSITVSAAPQTASITVNGLKATDPAAKVTYKQIIQLDSTGKWEWVNEYNDTTFKMTLEQIKAAVEASGNNTAAAAGSINPSLANMDFSLISTDSSTEKTADSDGKVTYDGLAAGLYAIQAVDTSNEYKYNWMLAYVGYENGLLQDATVTAKGESVKISKEIVNVGDGDNDKTIAAGEEVEYKITAKYPYFMKDETRYFEIKDNITSGNGMIVQNSVKVEVEGKDVTNKDFLVTYDPNNAGFTALLDSNSEYTDAFAGKNVVITYTVKADDDLNAPLVNLAESNNNKGFGSKHTVSIPTTSAEITKTNADGSKSLTGAKFTLYVAAPGSIDPKAVAIGNKTAIPVYEDVEVDASGKVKFEGLDIQKTYWVKETKAPEGYALEEEYKELIFTGNGLVEAETTENTTEDSNGVAHIESVTNYTIDGSYNNIGFNDGLKFHDSELSSLPSTGGIGTTIFTIGGCLIMIIAAALFFASRRKSEK